MGETELKEPRYVIWGAAPVQDDVVRFLGKEDYIIAADGGWKSAARLGIQPDCVLGDFDSSDCPTHSNVIRLPTEKDDTDTHFATKLAISRGAKEILYLGVIAGKRVDHMFAAIQSAMYAVNRGVSVSLTDGYCEMQILKGECHTRIPARENCYFSLLALSDNLQGVSERGGKYELENAAVSSDFPIGVSNEFVGKDVEISIQSGSALLIITPK